MGRSPSRKDVQLYTSHQSPARSMNGSVTVDMATDINLNKKAPDTETELMLWGMSLGRLPPVMQFLVLCLGIFYFYLVYGYLQVCIT